MIDYIHDFFAFELFKFMPQEARKNLLIKYEVYYIWKEKGHLDHQPEANETLLELSSQKHQHVAHLQ